MDKELIVSLLKRFNNRERSAFGEMYDLVYKELYYYAYCLYRNTHVEAEDVIHDLFVYIWDGKCRFESLEGLKSYAYLTIKHNLISYVRHQNMKQQKADIILRDENYYVLQAAEAEIFSLIPTVLSILPEDCVKSFRLFLEGWNVKEIAAELDRPLSTIYSQREKAISILKNVLPKDKLYAIMTLCGL